MLEKRSFEEALPLIQQRAEEGDRLTQVWLGLIHKAGAGTAIDPSASLRWLQLAAKAGSATARAWITRWEPARVPKAGWAEPISGKAEPLPKSIVKATPANGAPEIDWIKIKRANESAAKLGRAYAKYNLAVIALAAGDKVRHLTLLKEAADAGCAPAMADLAAQLESTLSDNSTPELLEEMSSLYARAAEAGHAESQWRLASTLLEPSPDNGLREHIIAADWIEKAAAQNHPKAMERLALMIIQGQGSLNPPERWRDILLKAAERARELFLKAAEQGQPDSFCHLALMLHSGQGGPRDAAQSVRYLEIADLAGSAVGQYYHGLALRQGWASAPDLQGALAAWERSASQNYVQAQRTLCELWLSGDGVPADLKKAIEYAEMAALNGDATMQSRLGLMLFNGEGRPADPAEGVTWLKRAAEKGEPGAIKLLAQAYVTGRGVGRDTTEAQSWVDRIPETRQRAGVLYELLSTADEQSDSERWLNMLLALSSDADEGTAKLAKAIVATNRIKSKWPAQKDVEGGLAALRALKGVTEARVALIALGLDPDSRLIPTEEAINLAEDLLANQEDAKPHLIATVIGMLLSSKNPTAVTAGITHYRERAKIDPQFTSLFRSMLLTEHDFGKSRRPLTTVVPQTSPDRNPSAANRPPAQRFSNGPIYPEIFHITATPGRAVVRFVVNEAGEVIEPAVVSATEPEFGEAALATIVQWRFWPARKNGRAVKSRVELPIDFSPAPK